MNSLFQSLIVVSLGTVLTVNGVLVHASDLISTTKNVVNQTNVAQLETVLELYYSDHNSYPDVSGGKALVDTLESQGYIQNEPLDPTVFNYQPKDNDQNYSLTLAQ